MFRSGVQRAAVAGVALMLGAAGCGTEGEPSADTFEFTVATSARLPDSVAREKVRGGSPEEETLVAAILAGLGSSSVTRVTLGDLLQAGSKTSRWARSGTDGS